MFAKKLALAEAPPSPFYGLALDVTGKSDAPKGAQQALVESTGELGIPFGIALVMQGSPQAVAAGIVLITMGFAARKRIKAEKEALKLKGV